MAICSTYVIWNIFKILNTKVVPVLLHGSEFWGVGMMENTKMVLVDLGSGTDFYVFIGQEVLIQSVKS